MWQSKGVQRKTLAANVTNPLEGSCIEWLYITSLHAVS
jgi:hypothetical protein